MFIYYDVIKAVVSVVHRRIRRIVFHLSHIVDGIHARRIDIMTPYVVVGSIVLVVFHSVQIVFEMRLLIKIQLYVIRCGPKRLT